MSIRTLKRISRTKTVATVGPACSTTEKLVELIEAGADVFRLNMAHGSRSDHETAIARIREANELTQQFTAILVDLAGPKIRLGRLQEDPLTVDTGQELTFVRGSDSHSKYELTCSYVPLLDELKIGDAVMLADGLIRLEVVDVTAERAVCHVVDGGTFRSRQGVNLPGTKLSIPALGDKDRENAIWAAAQDVQFVSLSFVRNAAEILELKQLLQQQNCEADVVAKIEKQEALQNLEEIVRESDVIMVARGDLGVEIAIEKTPLAQKQIIRVCSDYRKPVIVATQMLESMHYSKQPTRAEASDVANAILDGADACMLSGETAIGEYPRAAVAVMQRIMLETEEMIKGRQSRISRLDNLTHDPISDSIVYGAAQIGKRLNSEIVVITSSTGETARLKSKQRDYIQTICLTDDENVLRKSSLYWGIVPVRVDSLLRNDELYEFVNQWIKKCGDGKPGDPVVMVSDTEWLPGIHDTIMVYRIR